MWAVEHAIEMMWYANVWAHECFSRIFWYYGSYTSKTQQREGINTFNTLYSLQCINKSMCFILFLSIYSLSLSLPLTFFLSLTLSSVNVLWQMAVETVHYDCAASINYHGINIVYQRLHKHHSQMGQMWS